MYYITVEDKFSSAHQLRGYKGKCENIHGHNWRVVCTVKGKQLNEIGLLIDFHELKAILKDTMQQLDHRNINEMDQFRTVNPSSENLSRFVFESIAFRLLDYPGVTVDCVTVYESDTSSCTYREE